MAKQQVVVSECDSCHTTQTQPLSSGIKSGQYVLPNGWMHVEAITNNRTVFEVDMCEVCKLTVMEAAGKGRILKAVSKTG